MLSDTILNTIKSYVPEDHIRLMEPMSGLTTFRVGGPASCLVEPENEEQLAKVVKYLNLVGLPFFILGNGSNTVVKDAGYDGVVLHIGSKMNRVVVDGQKITAQAGASLIQVSRIAQENGLSGLEFAAGIPGSVGGGVVMNAGAYDGEMRQVVASVRVLSPEGEILELNNDTMEFGYRTSIVRKTQFIVLEVSLKLTPGDKDAILEKMNDFNARRREKQPLEYPSAGSTFKRPKGYYAGQLIMDAGLRGFQIGGARVSDKHCGFVINVGKASASDVLDVIGEVQERVKDRFDVVLEPEVVILG